MKLAVITGSRADWGLLEMPIKALEADPYFEGQLIRIWGFSFEYAFQVIQQRLRKERPDMVLVLGDRFEILAAATACHLERVPIAHIAGGDVSLGSYDDAMRDCISRMATIHFPTSREAEQRLTWHGYENIHWIGNLALDFILRGDWKRERPLSEPYVVVAYYPETIDGTVDWASVVRAIAGRFTVMVRPNRDAGEEIVNKHIDEFAAAYRVQVVERLERAEFLNLLYHADEFIGNSSALFYEAPALGVKTTLIGKRQDGRVAPTGDGKASERIVAVLKEWRA